jgi:ABC-type nitrate/sulfonate/bicarbonate transport system permease component
MKSLRKVTQWLLPAVLLVAWQLSPSILPTPAAIGRTLIDALLNGPLAIDAAHTLAAASASWVACLLIGVPLGMALGASGRLRAALSLLIELLRPIPAVALVPPAVLAFGFSWKTEIAVTVFASIWPVLSSSRSSIEKLHERYFQVAATLHLSKWHTVRSVITPAAFRQILVGAKLSFGLCLVVSVVAEMVGNPAGLGWGLVRAQEAMKTSEAFAYLFAIGMVGVAANAALDLAVRRLLPGLHQRH